MRWIIVLVGMVVLASGCARPGAQEATSPCDGEFGHGEFGADYAVVVRLSSPPAVGETARLTVGACGKRSAPVDVWVRLPDGFEWREPPAGATVTTKPAPSGGCAKTAAGRWDLAAMTPLTLTATVVATKMGAAKLAAFVDPADGRPVPGDSASVYLTVGAGHASSHFGHPEQTGDASASTATPRPVPVCD